MYGIIIKMNIKINGKTKIKSSLAVNGLEAEIFWKTFTEYKTLTGTHRI